MATVQEPKTGRAESFVGDQIDRARRRIRAQDIGVAALGLVAGTLAFALGMVLLDRWLHLPDAARQVALFGYLAAAAIYIGVVLAAPFRREVNPYFAARRVERAVPGAKNSVVSWLDLHDEPLPASIRAAVSQKAAADMKRADLDEVVRDCRLPWLGSTAGGLFVAAFILLFLLRPNQFLSLLGRTFAPFDSAAIATQTTLNLIQPAGGDVTVPVNTPVDFRVEVLGRVPDPTTADAVRLRLRYNPADPISEEIPLSPSARDPREFVVRVPAARVQTGFVYQIVGGDAVTPEHRVQVRSSPLIESFEVVYHYRPYLRFRDQTVANPNIEGLRGTTVTLTARTNRTVRDGMLTFQPVRDGQSLPMPLTAVAVPDQPAAMRFQFVLTDDAKYTIKFHSVEDESNGEPIPYTIKVLSDHAPQVEVTHPAPDALPVNGTIAIEGKASDDYGLTAMRLCVQLIAGDKPTLLAPKPYRLGKSFKFDDGTYPRALDYKDFLPLDQLKTTLGAVVSLNAGQVIEYWLEAEDNYDNPKPNIGKSQVFRMTLAAAQPPEDKQAGEQKAGGDQAEHNQKQDKNLDDQNKAKKQAGEQGNQNGVSRDAQSAERSAENANQPGEPKPGEGDPQDDAKDQAVEKQARELQDKIDRARQKNGKGEAKDKPPPKAGEQPTNPAEPKGDKSEKPDSNPQGSSQNQSGNQQGEKGGAKGDPKSAQPQAGGDKGEGKSEGQPKPQTEPGEAKDTKPQPQPGGGQGAGQNQPQPPNAGQQPPDNKQHSPSGAGEKPPQSNANQADNKQPNGSPGEKPGEQSNPGEAKSQPKGGDANAGEKKDQPQPNAQPGEAKSGGTEGGQKAGTNGGKPGDSPSTGGTPGGNSQDSKAGQSNGNPPSQPANDSGNTKPTNTDRTPSEGPQKNPDSNTSPPKKEPGAGGEAGNKGQAGELPGSGPKKDPNNQKPNGPPDANDPGRQGTGSGKPGDTAPKGNKPEDAPNGEGKGGAPDAGQAKPRPAPAEATDKGQGKPSGEPTDNTPGQPGGTSGQGELRDAPKGGHAQPGEATTTKPKTDGTASAGQPSGNKSPEQPAGNDPKNGKGQTGPGQSKPNKNKTGGDEKGAGELGKLAEDLKSADPKTRKVAEEQLKELMKQTGNDPQARKALEDAIKAAGEGNTPGTKPGGDKPEPGGAKPNGQGEKGTKPGDAEGDPKNQQPKAGDGAKPGPGEPGTKPGQTTEKPGQTKQPGDRSDPKPDGNKPNGQPGGGGMGQPKPGTLDPNRDGTGVPGDNPRAANDKQPTLPNNSATGPAPDAKHTAKTGELQLEKFPKNPSKELLQDLGMTEDQYRQFLKDAAELQKKRQAEAANNLQRGSNSGSSAANSGAKRIQGTGDKKDPLERGGASPAPPEYRDGYKGFTEDVSKPAGGAKKE
jgi:collagen type III alpha